MAEIKECTVSAPASTANIGPGFDIFGMGLDIFSDEIKVIKRESKHKKITIKNDIHSKYNVPLNYNENSAGIVISNMCKNNKVINDIDIIINKQIPPGYGMGSSAASAVAAAKAFNEVFDLGLNDADLIEYAAMGEIASAGIQHYDNVAGSLLGGFVIIRSRPKLEFIKFEPPSDLYTIVGMPKITVPKKKTEVSRSILPEKIPLGHAIENILNASTMVAGFALKDTITICKGINDKIIEPYRKQFIPSFDTIKQYAIESGALAFTISGAGPSVIAFLNTDRKINQVKESIEKGFLQSKTECTVFACKPSNGAKIIG